MGARIDLLLAVRRTPGPGTELVASGCRRRLTSQQPHLLLVGVDILDRAVGSDHVSARVDAHPLSDGGFAKPPAAYVRQDGATTVQPMACAAADIRSS